MSRKLASIDLGTHTARLLIAEWDEASQRIVPVTRYRTYVHLGDAFQNTSGGGFLSMDAAVRVVDTLHEFERRLHEYGVETTIAVVTGVIRQARNRDDFLRVLREETGIDAKVVSGEEEARLTANAVHHAADRGNKPHLVVDLGGGSTEFVLVQNDQWWVKSIAIGASVLTENYLKRDPPGEQAVSSLRKFVTRSLMNGLDRTPFSRVFSMVGTGGTIVTLGALLHGIPMKKLDPDCVNGLQVTRESIQALFEEMITLKREERVNRYGLDVCRAHVFPAGVLLATEIMNLFSLDQLTVCFSDLLEGLIWEQVEDNEYT
jgi:exopolyphosphatase / guanosine-5'-triphosphate,3'-diphosphate pyrophosphatase